MPRMPVLFAGHGSPMNAIEDNDFSRGWRSIAARIPKPEAILAVSAHWTREGTCADDSTEPRQVYDFYGFPQALYQVSYKPKGAPDVAREAARLLGAGLDNRWGIDHGTWSVLCWMYPDADIPVFQVSLDLLADRRAHYETGVRLRPLRDQGVLILGSGNVVHNLARVNWDMAGGYSWADEFDQYIQSSIRARMPENVIHYRKAGASASQAFMTLEHFDPLLTVLGASDEKDTLTVWNDARVLGALSMTSYLFDPTRNQV